MEPKLLTSKNKNSSTISRFFQPYSVIFQITFRQMFWNKKTMILSLVAFSPVILTTLFRFSKHDAMEASEFLPYMIIIVYLTFLSILLALFYGTAIISDEADNKTLTYLFTRPIRRETIILGKFGAYFLGVFLIIFTSTLLTFAVAMTDNNSRTPTVLTRRAMRDKWMPANGSSGLSSKEQQQVPQELRFWEYEGDKALQIRNRLARKILRGELAIAFSLRWTFWGETIGVLALALITYGAFFTFLGTCLKYAVLIGLLFAFGWEKIVLIVPGLVKQFSIIHYLLSSFPREHIPRQLSQALFRGTDIQFSNVTLSIIILLMVSIVFLSLSVFALYNKE
jgi:ABC-type transport system involved in multi-copper enzyme maturation permease subunit